MVIFVITAAEGLSKPEEDAGTGDFFASVGGKMTKDVINSNLVRVRVNKGDEGLVDTSIESVSELP
jgi:hypothetical protein